MIQERDEVVLTCDLPEHKLAAGDIGTVVLVHGEGRGYEIEFMTLDGETIGVSTPRADQVRQAHADEIAHALAPLGETSGVEPRDPRGRGP